VIKIERLKQLREAKNMTQVRLDIELGVSPETISGYEIGKSVPPADTLIKNAILSSPFSRYGKATINCTDFIRSCKI